MTHDAAFQSVDQHEDVKRLGLKRELNFVDSYRYNIAAYQLAELVERLEAIRPGRRILDVVKLDELGSVDT